ncbi:MAG: tRNA threonylcarbamoyladenosine dehydratase [Clostridiales bacterium]|nr:tRNA threonylcarbamoyladenosine dehydratase [Clostridiales bacterium]MDY4172641.1 tRNA threonylcarbamoyladenosine dehydratase [Evtepia sp.]
MDQNQFLRTEMLLGPAAMARLAGAHVAVFGIGGVGSWCAEALARAGVGQLTLVDNDQVGLTNLNRQAEALHSTLGQDKTAAMAQRIGGINPRCLVHQIPEKYEAASRERFFTTRYDYIVDAIDLVSCKLDLIETALARQIPIISSMGTGNKLDPSQFRVADLSKTEGCPLARIIRKELKARGILHHKVVFSPELPARTMQAEAPPPGRRSVPASAPWVPPVAGFLLAGAVIQDLIQV